MKNSKHNKNIMDENIDDILKLAENHLFVGLGRYKTIIEEFLDTEVENFTKLFSLSQTVVYQLDEKNLKRLLNKIQEGWLHKFQYNCYEWLKLRFYLIKIIVEMLEFRNINYEIILDEINNEPFQILKEQILILNPNKQKSIDIIDKIKELFQLHSQNFKFLIESLDREFGPCILNNHTEIILPKVNLNIMISLHNDEEVDLIKIQPINYGYFKELENKKISLEWS